MRTLVVGDLHLVKDSPQEVRDDVAELFRRGAGQRLVCLGDLFDLSADHPRAPRGAALRGALASQTDIRELLGRHLETGGELWLAGGNHDAAVGDPEQRDTLASELRLSGPARARLRTTPWFFRIGDTHLEHGHLFDPDNASSHPLGFDVRGLGVHFVEGFIAPTGAFRYLNNNDGTPLKLFASAFRWYGRRAPYVVFKYFDTAFRALLASGPFFGGGDDELRGHARMADFASNEGHRMPDLDRLRELAATPTMASLERTFSRLYLDRVAGTVSVASGLGLLAAGQRRRGLQLVAAGAAALSLSWIAGYDRYGGSVADLLIRGAEQIRRASGAKLVLMGHAHRESEAEGYANTGSFSFPRESPGRPYLELLDGSRAQRHYLQSD